MERVRQAGKAGRIDHVKHIKENERLDKKQTKKEKKNNGNKLSVCTFDWIKLLKIQRKRKQEFSCYIRG